MSNSLERLKNDLRRLAKRCKNIKYTEGLLLAFLMTGLLTFSQMGVTSPEIKEARQSIDTSISDMKKLFKEAKQENNKLLKQSNLELIQLMEQGDHVVKSPWSSWQFGGNYYYSDWQGTYKGRGDKSEKYPYEGVFTRYAAGTAEEMNRYIPKSSLNYSTVFGTSSVNDPTVASSNLRGTYVYGLADTQPSPEPPVKIELDVAITPKVVSRTPLNIAAPVPASAPSIEPIKFTPITPKIQIPDDPALPTPPSFKIIVGADCNNFGHIGHGCSTGARIIKGTEGTDGYEFLQYTWQSSYESQGLAFKWFDAVSDPAAANYIYGNGSAFGASTSETIDGGVINGTSRTTGNVISINSYGDVSGLSQSSSTTPVNRNAQYFLVGGSRAIEVDFSGGGYTVINAGTVKLNGILTLGMVTQTSSNANNVINTGTITDIDEKNQAYIQGVVNKYNTDTNGDSINDALRIYGSNTEVYDVKLSDEGYVGYKIGLAVVPENANLDKTAALNKGNINFYGGNSIGMYVYLPTTLGSNNTKFDGSLINSENINLYGKESYGMKLAGRAESNAKYENEGSINLQGNGNDFASNSVGMALMEDTTVTFTSTSEILGSGKAKNTSSGKINITSGVTNSIGMYINLDSDMTNEGTITINSEGSNVGMRADAGTENNLGGSKNLTNNAKVINAATTGKIIIQGKNGIGMLANGANAINKNEITVDTGSVLNGIGMVGINSGQITNEKTITIKDTSSASSAENLGIFINSGAKGTLTSTSNITVEGNDSTGILVTGVKLKFPGTLSVAIDPSNTKSSLDFNGTLTVKGNGVSGVIANGTDITGTAGGTITVSNGTNPAGETGTTDKKGSYGVVVTKVKKIITSDGTSTPKELPLTDENIGKFDGTGVKVDANVTGSASIGLYSEGILKVKEANIQTNDGAINFFANGANGSTDGRIEIGITGGTGAGTTITGEKSLLFYTKDKGRIILNANLAATIKGNTDSTKRGTAFYYQGSNYSNFGFTDVQNWAKTTFGDGTSTLNKLTLTMDPNSRLFVASDVFMNLTDTNPDPTSPTSVVNALGLNGISGSNYKTFMLYLSKLKIDQAVNLDDTTGLYKQLEIANSSIENADIITGTQVNQVAIAQENGSDSDGNPYKAEKVTLTNSAAGKITLTGDGSTGIYAKRGDILNYGIIDVAKNSTAIYLVEDNGSPSTAPVGATASNYNTITVGEGSTGLFYKAENTGTNLTIAGGISNDGKIESSSDSVVGMIAQIPSNVTNKIFENQSTGVINLQGDKSTGMFADNFKDTLGVVSSGVYTAENMGTITMADSASASSPNIGMFAIDNNKTLVNSRTISGGANTVGVYGYTVNLSGTSNTEIGDGGTGVYSQGNNVTIDSGAKIKIGKNKAVGVYYSGTNGNISNNASQIEIGDTSYGFVIQPLGTTSGNNVLTSNTSNVSLGTDSVYIYSADRMGTINNATSITSNGGENYGIYAPGTVTNSGNINFVNGVGNIGIYSVYGGNATNTGTITVGPSEPENKKYSVAMAAGYAWNKDDKLLPVASRPEQYIGSITNNGILNVSGKNSLGMYSTYNDGTPSKAVNNNIINLTQTGAIGMFIDEGAEGVNDGTITTVGSPTGVVGVVVRNGGTFTNTVNGKIIINSAGGYGIFNMGGIIKNYGTITVSGGAKKEGSSIAAADVEVAKKIEEYGSTGVLVIDPKATDPSRLVTVDGVPVTYTELYTTTGNRNALISSFGLYIDTLIGTNPIDNLGAIGVHEAELLVGIDAAKEHNEKAFVVKESILKPYRDAMEKNKTIKWSINSAALTWAASPKLDNDKLPIEIVMAKIPYTYFASDKNTTKDTYNFTDGLEQRYGVEELTSREKALFNKLNEIGNNEETLLYQAYDEMMGHQYANVQQRIYGTGRMLDKEITHLTNEWATKSKESNKIKAFGMRDEYSTDTAGIIDYKSDAYGFAYVHEDETVKLGNTTGWYAGAVHNRIRFKDIGNSKENTTMLKAGVFKSTAFDHNGSLKWTISGEGYVARSNMHRKYLVVDEIFEAKSDYNSYGVAIKNEIGKEFRTSERTSIRPYGSLKLEYGRFSDIEEKSGEVRLEVQGNDYYSIRPEVGVEFKYKQPMAVRTTFVTTLGLGYESELGKVGDVGNKARVNYTTADWFNIRGEKDDRKGNFKADLNIGIENQRFGVTLNAGYDTKGENIRGGIGFRAIY